MDRTSKWGLDYIDGIDLTEIEWIKLDTNQLREFYQENYLDRDVWQYVAQQPNISYYYSPLGLRYLSFDYNGDNYSFLLGIVDNNIGKKTIVAAMVYLENYYLFNDQKIPFTYISSVEVNSYFWNNGIYKRLCEKVINFINLNQHILLSSESDMGREYGVSKKLKDILLKNGFKNAVMTIGFSGPINSELHDIVCGRERKLERTTKGL